MEKSRFLPKTVPNSYPHCAQVIHRGEEGFVKSFFLTGPCTEVGGTSLCAYPQDCSQLWIGGVFLMETLE